MNMNRTLLAALLASGAPFAFAQEPDTDANASGTEPGLEEMVVTGQRSQVELLQEYSGGQVARGGRAGLLGNLDFLDAPFSGTAYTASLAAAQQAESVGDVLQNDPVVRVAKGFGNFQEVYILRGFPVYSDDITLNGVYGILPRQFVAAELVERVEVFRGANAFLNGAAPGGSGTGGTVNLVPKRAPGEGIAKLTAGYESDAQYQTALDVGQRFGENDAWGIRVNAVRRDGEAAIENQERELTVFSLGTDYAGERFRFSADFGYQDNHVDQPLPQVTPLGDIPAVPESNRNFGQPWTYSDEKQSFGVVRGEYDVTDAVKVWLAGGARSGEEANLLANPKSDADGNLSSSRFDNTREDDVTSLDGGVELTFNTGSINQTVVFSASSVDLESKNAFAFYLTPFTSDLYDPVVVTPPQTDIFPGGDLNDPLLTEKTKNESLALAYTAGLLDDRLLATVGLRHQNIKTNTFDYNDGSELSGYDASKVTPALGLVWKSSDNLSFYGNYAESLQPGSVVPAISGGVVIDNAGEVIDPLTGEQVELGVKYDAGTFATTVSAFTLERANTIVVDQRVEPSGRQENKGIEVSVFGEPSEGVRLIGGATYLQSELARTEGGVNQGNSPIGVPELQANFNIEWDVWAARGLTLEARVVYTDSQYANEENTVELDSWQRFDLGARYATELNNTPVTLRARLDNVFDEHYWASTGGFPGANYLIMGNPRTLSLSASIDF
ncbi:TonB-dependent receptor [Gilvimarinus chinensis]|uniref:TonB-dependent receptor n=1 Tax=Gilvimarinus chinensis TaxID=396005 RepID=UPI0003737307|nr:TonB-dependent receptor [Gilvimarinus chinensis]